MAIDAIRYGGRVIDFDFAKEPSASSLRALAGSVAEIPYSLFVAGQPWEPPGVVTRFGRNEGRIIFCDGGGQPAFYVADDVCDFSGYSLDSFLESDPVGPGPSRSGVAQRIPGGSFCMACALAADFRSRTGCGAIA